MNLISSSSLSRDDLKALSVFGGLYRLKNCSGDFSENACDSIAASTSNKVKSHKEGYIRQKLRYRSLTPFKYLSAGELPSCASSWSDIAFRTDALFALNWACILELRTVGEEEVGTRVFLIARCEIADDSLDVLSCRHQDIDSLEGLRFSMVRNNFDD